MENEQKSQQENGVAAEPRAQKVKKVISNVFFGIGIAFAVFLVIVIVWLCVEKYILKKPVPFVMGVAAVSVLTGSMNGTIDEGSLIWLSNTGDYQVDDIITFLPDGDTIPTTHRIIRIENGLYYTKGDANDVADTNPIRYENICGEVTAVWKDVGYFSQWLTEGYGWIFFVLIIAVIAATVIILKKLSAEPESENSDKEDGGTSAKQE